MQANNLNQAPRADKDGPAPLLAAPGAGLENKLKSEVRRWSPMSSSGFAKLCTKTDGDIGLHQPKPSRLWLWFVAAFVLQAAAWTAWFVIAAQHQVQEVPLARSR